MVLMLVFDGGTWIRATWRVDEAHGADCYNRRTQIDDGVLGDVSSM